MIEAKPEHFKVDRTGGLPPNAQYFVLDIVNDFEARVVLARLGTNYARQGQQVKADEAFKALADSQDAHRAAIELRNPKQKKAAANKKVHA